MEIQTEKRTTCRTINVQKSDLDSAPTVLQQTHCSQTLPLDICIYQVSPVWKQVLIQDSKLNKSFWNFYATLATTPSPPQWRPFEGGGGGSPLWAAITKGSEAINKIEIFRKTKNIFKLSFK